MDESEKQENVNYRERSGIVADRRPRKLAVVNFGGVLGGRDERGVGLVAAEGGDMKSLLGV